MTEAAKLSKGYRLRLEGIVEHYEGRVAFIRFDGATSSNSIEPSALTKATILPRELKVGDWVRIRKNGEYSSVYRIECIVGERAAISYDNCLQRTTFDLSDLSLDPDHKDDGE